MPTPAYTELDSNAPDGTTAPGTYTSKDLANVRALRDMAIAGRASGFIQSRTTGTGPDAARPQRITWLNATLTIGFRVEFVWGGTGNYQPTSVEWSWSNDNGASWTVMGTAQANTFDGSDNITATTNSGGFSAILLEVWTKCLRVVAGVAAHIAATGTAVHGLGSMSTQAASAVAVTGGAIDGTALGATTPANVDATRVREKANDYGTLTSVAGASSIALEADKYGHMAFTPPATTTDTVAITVTGIAASGRTQGFLLEIINGRRSANGKITYPANAKFIGSGVKPDDTTLQLAGRDFYSVTIRDGGTRQEWQYIGKGG